MDGDQAMDALNEWLSSFMTVAPVALEEKQQFMEKNCHYRQLPIWTAPNDKV